LIDLKIKEHIAILEFDNPPMNLICEEMLNVLEEKLNHLFQKDIEIAILTGKGDAFIAGADINEMKEMSPEEAKSFSRKGQKIFDKLRKSTFPVIGAINGYALGGGLELALNCDILIASDEALFGEPEVKLGIIPAFGGTYNLAEAVGTSRAKELIFTGKKIDAETAEKWGLINMVVPHESLMEEARNMAQNIASNSSNAIGKAKMVIQDGKLKKREEALELESDKFSQCFKSKDSEEGMQAFLEKREPEF